MSTLQSYAASPFAVGVALLSFLALVYLVTRKRYRLRIKKSGFEFLIEPHTPALKVRPKASKETER